LVTAPAGAAEINTYRAGAAYLKTPAQSYQQCEAQCRGDAACRGWNFIRPNPSAQSGICEFNARFARPVTSPISVSGEVHTEVDTLMSRAVPGQGHTIRVGTPVMPKPQTRRIVRRQPVAPARPIVKANVQRRIPARVQDRVQDSVQTGTPATKPVNPHKPRIYGGPIASPPPAGTLPPQAHMTMAEREQAVTRLSREQVTRRQILAAQRRAIQGQTIQRQTIQRQPIHRQARPGQEVYRRPAPDMAPQAGGQIQAALPQTSAPQTGRPQDTSMQARQMTAMSQRIAPPQNRQTVPVRGGTVPSLYGNLNDDLTTGMTPVPRPETAPDNPADPDAPISTVHPAPVTPVRSTPLVPSALAGG
ncbi:MAG TPA: hypothetical protein ENK01_04270, partial [Hellea balneolensis]|nr:hypothetical protein [Hellea balneolensis]